MKTKILIAVLSIGLFSTSTMFAQEKEQAKMNHEHMEKATYTCPMHADVKGDKPGACAKCGMEMKIDVGKTPACCAGMNASKMAKASYTCPMKCEGEKTYDKAGSCPKCKMDLKKVSEDKNASCCAGMDHSKMEMKMETPKMANATYACPMKCEGEKTYDKAGSCPKCNMDLKKMEIKKEK